LLEQAVHVTDEGAVAAAGQDGVVALVEHLRAMVRASSKQRE